jgi:hypothetical protein
MSFPASRSHRIVRAAKARRRDPVGFRHCAGEKAGAAMIKSRRLCASRWELRPSVKARISHRSAAAEQEGYGPRAFRRMERSATDPHVRHFAHASPVPLIGQRPTLRRAGDPASLMPQSSLPAQRKPPYRFPVQRETNLRARALSPVSLRRRHIVHKIMGRVPRRGAGMRRSRLRSPMGRCGGFRAGRQ